ncbi:MAG: hypothetical protein HY360_14445 [Verrucomicrobia bacterium]|nr:hypothetical protein [Verrucomicrobiota bacterium]
MTEAEAPCTPARQWVFDDLRRWKEAGGLDYVWFDSLGNLGLLPIDYAQDMTPNTFAIAEFIADLQSIGIANIAVEGMSPLGMSSAHVFDPNCGDLGDVQGIVGQNSWEWHLGNEDLFCDQAPRIDLHAGRSEEEARQIFFRCLANRCVPALGKYSQVFGPTPAWFKEYLDAYLVVETLMESRRLLPDKQGVLWTSRAGQALFTLKSFRFALPRRACVEQVCGGKPQNLMHDGILAAQPWRVYRITNSS